MNKITKAINDVAYLVDRTLSGAVIMLKGVAAILGIWVVLIGAFLPGVAVALYGHNLLSTRLVGVLFVVWFIGISAIIGMIDD